MKRFFSHSKDDDLVKSHNFIEFVIPAKAGIQLFQDVLDSGFRRGDDPRDFLRNHHLSSFGFSRLPKIFSSSSTRFSKAERFFLISGSLGNTTWARNHSR